MHEENLYSFGQKELSSNYELDNFTQYSETNDPPFDPSSNGSSTISQNPFQQISNPSTPSSRRQLTGYMWNQLDEPVQRPLTSVNAVGYSSDYQQGELSEKLLLQMRGSAPPLQKKSENSPEDEAMEMEKEVNRLIEQSSQHMLNKEYIEALEVAKLAEKKERELRKFRDEKNIGEINYDLTCSVLFNVARQYEANGMYTEALDTYSSIVKNKNFTHGARLRVNMGNIYFEQQKYPMAIKMYRMAYDKVNPVNGKETRLKILRNIGMAFVKMTQYKDAVENFEQIVESNNYDVQTAYNLLICYYALGEKKKMKRAFGKLLRAKLPGVDNDDYMLDDPKEVGFQDDLYKYLKEKEQEHWNCILKSAKLIAPVIDENWEEGFNWIIEELKTFARKKDKSCNLVSEIEMAKALYHLKQKQFNKAIEELKAFEKKRDNLQARALTNLSYLYYLEGDLVNAEKYVDQSLAINKYNASALVNKGNIQIAKNEVDEAIQTYRRALNVEADCFQAMYNLGLALKIKGEVDEAIHQFKKLLSIFPEHIEVTYQLGLLYEMKQDYTTAREYLVQLSSYVPTDPGVLYKLGSIYTKEGDKPNCFAAHLESYRYWPVNMDVISWLGLYFVERGIYEDAVQYFERATELEPNKADWELMVASCHRRLGQYQQAKKIYEDIHKKYPENRECLQYLVQICTDLGLRKDANKYTKQLRKLEEKLAKKSQSSETQQKIKSAVDDCIKILKQKGIEFNEFSMRESLTKMFEEIGTGKTPSLTPDRVSPTTDTFSEKPPSTPKAMSVDPSTPPSAPTKSGEKMLVEKDDDIDIMETDVDDALPL